MMDDQLTPDEQELVRHIQATAKPQLTAAARDTIRRQMLHEYRVLAASGQLRPAPRQPHISQYLRLALVAAAVIVVGVVLLQINQPPVSVVGTATLTASPGGQIAIVPSAAISPTRSTEQPTIVTTEPTEPSMTAPVVMTTPALVTETAAQVPTATPSSLPPLSNPTMEPETIMVIEGPVTNVVDNMVTIYDFNIEVEAQHPILKVITIGDPVRVQGALNSNGTVTANVVSNLPEVVTTGQTPATVSLEGPVEAIQDTTIVVNGIAVQLAPDDPLWQTLQVGNFVSVQGNFQNTGATIVLVVVKIAIVPSPTTPNNCWYHNDGMGMGHWHCDGMGMGDAMGMKADGMGMGDAIGMEG